MLPDMNGGFDELDVNKQIINTLEDAIELDLVEITGITPDGQWLYSATKKCRKLLEENTSFLEIAQAIEALGRKTDTK
jgi:hypothetical protein